LWEFRTFLKMSYHVHGETKQSEQDRQNHLAICQALENILTRYADIEDITLRNMLTLDKFFIAIDIFDGYLLNVATIHPEVKAKAKEISVLLKKVIKDISLQVTQPLYAPDRALGKSIMNAAKSDFSEAADKKTE